MTESNQCESIRLAAMALADGEPSALTDEQVREHLQRCPACRAAVEQLSAVDAAFHNTETPGHAVDVWPLLSSEIAGNVPDEQSVYANSATDSPWSSMGAVAITLVVVLVLAAMCAQTVMLLQTAPDLSTPWANSESGIPSESASTPQPYEIPYGAAKHVDPAEFRRRFMKYFETGYQRQQKTALRDRTDADHWRPVGITVQEGSLGTLFIDDEGKITLASKYPLVDVFSEGLAMVGTTVSDDARLAIGGYGFIDQTGRCVIPGIYEEAGRFSDGLAVVKKNGKYGYINRRGKVVVDFKYQRAEVFQDGIARCWVEQDNARNPVEFIDTAGKVLFRVRADNIGRFSEGLVYANLSSKPLKEPIDPSVDQEAPDRLLGYLNRRFEFEIRIDDEMPGDRYVLGGKEFHEGLAEVAIGHRDGERKGYISRDGTLVIEGKYLQVQPFSNGLAAVSVTTQPKTASSIPERWGFIDKTGKMVIEPQFLWTEGFREGKAAVLVELDGNDSTTRRGQWGFIDKQGKLIIKPQFYRATNFAHGLARVDNNPFSYGYINESGEYVWRLDVPAYGYGAGRK